MPKLTQKFAKGGSNAEFYMDNVSWIFDGTYIFEG